MTRTLLTLAAGSPDLRWLQEAARARTVVRGVLIADINGDTHHIVEAVPSVLVSGAREAAGLQEVEFEGKVERSI